jgi:hypothetical protein
MTEDKRSDSLQIDIVLLNASDSFMGGGATLLTSPFDINFPCIFVLFLIINIATYRPDTLMIL